MRYFVAIVFLFFLSPFLLIATLMPSPRGGEYYPEYTPLGKAVIVLPNTKHTHCYSVTTDQGYVVDIFDRCDGHPVKIGEEVYYKKYYIYSTIPLTWSSDSKYTQVKQ